MILSQEGDAGLDADQDAGQDPELWNLVKTEQMADFEEIHPEGGPMLETTIARKDMAERTPLTPPSKKTRTTESWAAEQGGAQPSQVQRLSARAMQNPRDTELLALSQRAFALNLAFASSRLSAQRAFASWLGSTPVLTLADTGQPASTRRVDTRMRDR